MASIPIDLAFASAKTRYEIEQKNVYDRIELQLANIARFEAAQNLKETLPRAPPDTRSAEEKVADALLQRDKAISNIMNLGLARNDALQVVAGLASEARFGGIGNLIELAAFNRYFPGFKRALDLQVGLAELTPAIILNLWAQYRSVLYLYETRTGSANFLPPIERARLQEALDNFKSYLLENTEDPGTVGEIDNAVAAEDVAALSRIAQKLHVENYLPVAGSSFGARSGPRIEEVFTPATSPFVPSDPNLRGKTSEGPSVWRPTERGAEAPRDAPYTATRSTEPSFSWGESRRSAEDLESIFREREDAERKAAAASHKEKKIEPVGPDYIYFVSKVDSGADLAQQLMDEKIGGTDKAREVLSVLQETYDTGVPFTPDAKNAIRLLALLAALRLNDQNVSDSRFVDKIGSQIGDAYNPETIVRRINQMYSGGGLGPAKRKMRRTIIKAEIQAGNNNPTLPRKLKKLEIQRKPALEGGQIKLQPPIPTQTALDVGIGSLRAVGYAARAPANERKAALKRAVKQYGRDHAIKKINALAILNKRRPDLEKIYKADLAFLCPT